MKWMWARLIWAWRNIPRTPKKGGGASVWLFLFWQERLTSPGQILVVVTLLLTFLSALPYLPALRIFALFLWVLHAIAWLRTFWKPALLVHWDFPKMVFSEDPFSIAYHIQNHGKSFIHRVSLQWVWEETWIVDAGALPEVFSLAPGEKKTVLLQVKARGRGLCKLRGPVVFVQEPMGWWRARIKSKQPWELGVFQSATNLLSTPLRLAQGLHWGEPEWLGTMRYFRKGDTIRSISHRAWARSGKPLVREIGHSGDGITLFVDYGCRYFLDRMALDVFCSLTVQMAQRIEQRGLLDGVWLYGTYLEKHVGSSLSEELQLKLSLLPRPLWWAWPKPLLNSTLQAPQGIYWGIGEEAVGFGKESEFRILPLGGHIRNQVATLIRMEDVIES